MIWLFLSFCFRYKWITPALSSSNLKRIMSWNRIFSINVVCIRMLTNIKFMTHVFLKRFGSIDPTLISQQSLSLRKTIIFISLMFTTHFCVNLDVKSIGLFVMCSEKLNIWRWYWTSCNTAFGRWSSWFNRLKRLAVCQWWGKQL